MIIRLVVYQGPRKGDEFVVKGDITIGRNKGDLQLRDSKSSGHHAKIIIDSNGIPEIHDLGSSNGTAVNGVKIKSAGLKPGDRVHIGRTKMRVEAYVPENETGLLEKGSWQEVVDGILSEGFSTAEKTTVTSQFGVFDPPLSLKIESGIQTGIEMVYSFGPRKVGAAGSDFLLFEPQCPLLAFELFPTGIGECTLKSHSQMVRVNGHEAKSLKLSDGDKIEIGKTRIAVKALKVQ